MKKVSSFVHSVLGGVMVSIGGIVYLSLDNKYLGSFLFTVGLFTIYTMGFNLYTGKVCYCLANKPAYLGFVASVWVGNLVGTVGVGSLLRLTRAYDAVYERAVATSEAKLNDGLLSVFILAVLCNMLIYIAADSYTNNPHELGKYLGMVFGVMVFILAGFEHCIANMFYFTVAGVWSPRTVGYLLIMTLGNGLGGLLLPAVKVLRKKAEA